MNESKLFYHLQSIDDLVGISYTELQDIRQEIQDLVNISYTELQDIRQSIQLSDERIAETEYKQLELLRGINTNLSYILFVLILFGALILKAVWKYLQ